jgi:protein ImuB
MSRIVSVWLRAWPIARLLSAQASAAPADASIDLRRPLALVAPGKGGARIVSLNRAARQGGLEEGELVSNARSKVLDLQARDADPAADAAALRKLALWCLRYTPIVAAWDEGSGADGLFLDIAGCAHLFSGEARLLADLEKRLRAFGLYPRLAIAGTAGASWAVARHGERDGRIVSSGEETEALRNLPLAALRLSAETQLLMRRLGFKRIGELTGQPRAPFAARFAPELLRRLDQALGRAPEPLIPAVAPPLYHARAMFLEPILSQEHVLEAATRLLRQLSDDLARDAVGARVLRLLLFRVVSETRLQHDDGVQSFDLGLAAPSREPEHIARLIALRLDRLGDGLDADFGFEAAAIHVLVAEPLPERQVRLTMDGENASPDGLARLIDRLQQRLGAGAVCRLHPYESHTPERAVRARAACSALPDWAVEVPSAARPLLLLPRPEAAAVVALIPEGPPRQFRWRGVLHQVAEAQGPERITPEWWRRTAEATRDYYIVEDTGGHSFWLYRAGLYGRGEATPQWFVHGVFG